MILHVQGLRGIAIIAVLLFHLWPLNFPNGYVGVDMFFVLSGYLMAMIFSKHKFITIAVIIDFYYKRIKRIFPLYYLIIPLTFIAGQIFMNIAWISTNARHCFYSMLLLKNLETIRDRNDYFQGFQSEAPLRDLFLHTWSLAVEIQFYLVVPFIFLILSYFPKFFYKIGILAGISIISCGYYFYTEAIFSFNFPLCRLWQFSIGMIAFLTYKRFENSIGLIAKEANEANAVKGVFVKQFLADWSILSVIILLLPITINSTIIRPLFTVVTAVLLVLHSGMTNKILQHCWLTKIGDISYTLYLVHWPVIVLFKRENFFSYQLSIGIIIFISIILFKFYEEFYRKLSKPSIFALLAALFVVNGGIFYTVQYAPDVTNFLQEIRLSQLDPTVRAAVKGNEVFLLDRSNRTAKTYYNESASTMFHYPFGVYDYKKGTGDKRVIVIGNSYSGNQGDLIHQEFNNNYSFQGLYNNNDFSPPLPAGGFHYTIMKMVEEYAPNVIFLATRFNDFQKVKITVKDIKDDPLVKKYNENVARLEAKGAKVFIQGGTPLYPRVHLNLFMEALENGSNLERFHLNKTAADAEMEPGEIRLAAIKCKRCEVIDTASGLVDGNIYLGFEKSTNLSYIDNSRHFTNLGLERIRPVYRKIVRALLEK